MTRHLHNLYGQVLEPKRRAGYNPNESNRFSLAKLPDAKKAFSLEEDDVEVRSVIISAALLFCSFLFFSVLFCSFLFFSVLFCSFLFFSVLEHNETEQDRTGGQVTLINWSNRPGVLYLTR